MKPAPFKYHAPSSLEEALGLLAEHEWDAKVLAGGQSLVPLINFRLAQPLVMVDLNNVQELFYLQSGDNGETLVGAMTRQATVEHSSVARERCPMLHGAMARIAYPQIRSRGTIGGSIAHADPAAELAAVSVALKARFRILSTEGERWVDAEDFFTGLFMTVMEPYELLVEIAIPPTPSRSGWSFEEITRRHHDFAMAGMAVAVSLDEQGLCDSVRMAFLALGDGPMLARNAARVLEGQKPSAELFAEAAAIASQEDIDPSSDIHASVDYRRHLAGVLAKRGLREAFERASSPS
jgi:carbon-monoxide dehydrogenase medium subunit